MIDSHLLHTTPFSPFPSLNSSFFGLRCLSGLDDPLTLASPGLRFTVAELPQLGEGECRPSVLSSLLAVSELPDPELTPLEEWRTKDGGPVEEPLTEPNSRVVWDKEEAKMEARTLCLLPRRTDRERKLYL